jgi:PKD repeat protein
MTYDAADGYIIMVGGYTYPGGDLLGPDQGVLNDTWLFSDGAWTQGTSFPQQLVWDNEMTYDAADGYVALFGETVATPATYGVWSYLAGAWHRVASGDPALFYDPVTYDAADGYVLDMGGNGSYATYKYIGGAWTFLDPSKEPTWNGWETLVYDPAAKAVVLPDLASGFAPRVTSQASTTWEYAAGSWTDITSQVGTPPSLRDGASMVYDAHDGEMILFGGVSPYGTFYGDTWTFGGNASVLTVTPSTVAVDTQITLNTTVIGGSPPFTYTYAGLPTGCVTQDAAEWTCTPTAWGTFWITVNVTYGVGGLFSGNAELEVTGPPTGWGNVTWSGMNSTNQPDPPTDAIETYDAADHELLVIDQWHYDRTYESWMGFPEVWSFANGTWTNLTYQVPATLFASSSGIYFQQMVYDAADGYVLLVQQWIHSYNGAWTPSGLNFWTYYGGMWTNITGSVTGAPPASFSYGGVAYDEEDHAVIMVVSGGVQTETYEYRAGVWSMVTTSPSQPDILSGFSMSWDTADDSILLVSGIGYASQTISTFHAGVWTTVETSFPLDSFQVVDDPAIGYAIIYGGFGNGEMNETYLYAAGTWVQYLPILPAPPGGFGSTLVYYPPMSAVISLGGSATNSASPYPPISPIMWTFRNNTNAIAITSFTASPSNVPLGQSTYLNVSAQGGSGVFHYNYTGLPGGCLTENVSSLPCTPSVPGTYSVKVFVNDTKGRSAFSSLTLRDYVPFTEVEFSAAPNPAILGEPVNFTSTVAGGVSPITWAWNFGDGTIGGNLQDITHIYTTNGPFEAELSVTDHIGTTAYAYLNITIRLQATALANVTVGAAPLAVGFTSQVRGGAPAYTYSWSFGDGGTSTAPDPSHTFVSQGSYLVELEVVDSAHDEAVSYLNETVTQGGTPLAIGLEAVPPSLEVGNSSIITATPTGGHGTYTVTWPGKPAWCAAVTVLSLNCTPVAVGNFTLEVSVTDATGTTATNSVTLIVTSNRSIAPLALTIAVQPGNMTVGSPFLLTAVPSGGQPPYVISWPGLPDWCSEISSTTIKCVPPAQGDYTFTADVMDSAGKTATASVGFIASCGVGQCPVRQQQSTFLGLPGNDGYILIAALVAAVVVIALVAYRSRRKRPEIEGGNETVDAFQEYRKPPTRPEDGPIDILGEGQTDPAEDLL